MIRIVALDSSPLLLEGMEKVIQHTENMTLTHRITNARELMPILARDPPDILTMELALPDRSGLELLKDLMVGGGTLAVLILSIHSVQRFAIRALRAGAKGCLDKTVDPDELRSAIRRIVIQKKRYISSTVAQHLASMMDTGARPPHEALADREFEVLCLIADGKATKRVAAMLSLSLHTVHTYRSRVMKKLDVTSHIGMTRYALTHDLID